MREQCEHKEYTLNGTVSRGAAADMVKINLSCSDCGAVYQWLPFMGVEKQTGDLLLSARLTEPPKILSVTADHQPRKGDDE